MVAARLESALEARDAIAKRAQIVAAGLGEKNPDQSKRKSQKDAGADQEEPE